MSFSNAKVCYLFNKIKGKYNFGYESLNAKQVEVVNYVLNKQAVTFSVLPTGYGKSETFALPPLLLDEVREYWFHFIIVSFCSFLSVISVR